ncbi:hypothetical protein C2845_PM11G07830 [Panicum miliaceum]|uniref:Disease resistance N-terminal domain-containing protein n=1 Tax=Panicum miliaceum TaxID=4540 RepID=A0A3L6RVZ7_PANMI|nr:hypothetical protein C2845_PM11G07830 [Panicum miliaceum]
MALGMTRTLVEGALGRIQAAIEEENKLKEGVPQDLAFITGEFQMMQSFLKDANRERARKTEVARTWVRQLRDLAFDVENWVEFVVHIDTPKSGAWDLDEAAADMKLLKARVEDLSHRNTRYNLFSTDDGSPPGSGSGLDSKKATAASINNLSHRALLILRQVWVNELGKLRMVGGDSGASILKSLLIAPDAVSDGDLRSSGYGEVMTVRYPTLSTRLTTTQTSATRSTTVLGSRLCVLLSKTSSARSCKIN